MPAWQAPRRRLNKWCVLLLMASSPLAAPQSFAALPRGLVAASSVGKQRANENPAICGGVRNDPKSGGESQTGATQLSGGDALFDLGRLAQHIAAAPDGLDVV